MTDDFDTLSKLQPPRPSDSARARALDVAMRNFDAEEKKAASSQGFAWVRRQSSILNRIWSTNMIAQNRFMAGSALATLLILPAAVFVTFEITRGRLPATGEVPLPPLVDMPAPAIKKESITQPKMAKPSLEERSQDSAQTRTQHNSLTLDPRAASKGDANTAYLLQKNVSKPEIARSAPVPAAPMMVAPAPQSGPIVSRLVDSQQAPAAQAGPTGDRFANAEPNPVKSVATDPVSTFSVDVDTASYSLVRRSLMEGQLPDPDSVRVEEMVNYFPYDWPRPQTAETPFRSSVTVTPTPWNAGTRLMNIAIKGYETPPSAAPPANLVFLIDVSGSMNEPDKLPLLKSAFRLLVGKLRPEDKVSIVTYAGNAGTVLEPTAASEPEKILAAIDALQPGGSTAGAAGIEAAYRLARGAFIKGGINRVMLATDGDFNVGPSSAKELNTLIETRRQDGIFLSVLGFGKGNLNDALMQSLAQKGNGTASYIDTLSEAQKVLVQEAGSTLFPIAKDVKIQVEFNPAKIAEYRLIGYETRALKREDFNNDRVDAGDIGSGHAVTAIYEVTPKGSESVLNDPLRYSPAPATPPSIEPSDELAFVKIRYKQPDGDTSKLITTAVTELNAVRDFGSASQDVRFATAVAAFGQKLRGTDALAGYSYVSILNLATGARGEDPFGYRAGFLDLVRLAESLDRK